MRYEKALAKLPVPPCPNLAQRPMKKIDDYKKAEYIRYSAEVVDMKGENVLSVTTYGTDESAKYRFFLLKDQYGMQAFEQQEFGYHQKRLPEKIYRAAMNSIYRGLDSPWWSSTVQRMYSTAASDNVVYQFLEKTKADGNPIQLLVARQEEIRKEKIDARDDKERAKLREAFAGVDKAIPLEFKAYVEEVPLRFHRYFFFEYTGKKEQSGTCSHCGKRSTLSGIKERKKGTCPNCGTSYIFYSAKRLCRSHGVVARGRAAFIQPVNENRIVVRCCQVGMALRGGSMGIVEKDVWAHEDLRIFLDGTGREIERYESPAGTTIKVYLDGLTFSKPHYSLWEHWIAPMNLELLRKRMGIYTPLETLASYGLETQPNQVFITAKKKPKIEYLVKMGLLGIAAYEFCDAHNESGKNSQSLFLNGKKAAELLGVPSNVIPLLKEANPSGRAFLVIRSLLKCGLKLTVQDMRDISQLRIRYQYSDRLFDMAKECSIHKALKYIGQQSEIFKSDGDHVLQQWGDYLGMAKQLHMNLGDHCVIMPKNLKAAHDEAVKLLDYKKNEKLNQKMKITADKLQDLCWEFDGLTIRPAVSQGELFNEGKALSHCVGRMSYAEKQAKGTTAIFFIRNKKTPDESYVTLELDLKTWMKIQCYGKHDSYPGKKVNNFVRLWIRDVVMPSRFGTNNPNATG